MNYKPSMKRARFNTAAIFVAVAVLTSLEITSAQAQEWAKPRLNNSPRHGEWVEVKSGDRTIKAFVVYPERKTKRRSCSLFTRFLD